MMLSVMMLASCGETPASLINSAMANMAQLDSLEVKSNLEAKTNVMGTDMTLPVVTRVQMTGAQGDSPVVLMDMEVSMMGITSKTTEYNDGEWIYISVDGINYKVDNVNKSAMLFNGVSAKTLLQELAEDLLQGAKIVKNEDGSKTVALTIPAAVFTEMYAPMLNNLNKTVGTAEDAMTVSDADVKLTVKDGYLTKYEMNYTVDMVVEGMDASASMAMTAEFLNPGQDVTITPPAGYQDFPELDD